MTTFSDVKAAIQNIEHLCLCVSNADPIQCKEIQFKSLEVFAKTATEFSKEKRNNGTNTCIFINTDEESIAFDKWFSLQQKIIERLNLLREYSLARLLVQETLEYCTALRMWSHASSLRLTESMTYAFTRQLKQKEEETNKKFAETTQEYSKNSILLLGLFTGILALFSWFGQGGQQDFNGGSVYHFAALLTLLMLLIPTINLINGLAYCLRYRRVSVLMVSLTIFFLITVSLLIFVALRFFVLT